MKRKNKNIKTQSWEKYIKKYKKQRKKKKDKKKERNREGTNKKVRKIRTSKQR